MLQQLRCPRCGKRICDLTPDSTVEVPCKWCKRLIKYDKGAITVKQPKAIATGNILVTMSD